VSDGEILIRPVPWQPHPLRLATEAPRRRRVPRVAWAVALPVVLVAGFLLAARAVEVEVQPAPDRLEVRGGLQVHFRGVRLLLPGGYTVHAEKAGYAPLEASLAVTRDPRQVARYALERLPGFLALGVTPPNGVRVTVDGTPRGATPMTPLELAEGDHDVRLEAEGYAIFTERVRMSGGGETQHLEATLRPDRAAVSFDSEPRGAQVRVDGAAVGATPLTVDLRSGDRHVDVGLEGYEPQTRRIAVTVDVPQRVPTFRLAARPGRIAVRSEPPGAAVTIGGRFRGETPLEVDVTPDVAQSIRVTKAGHRPAEETVTVTRGETRAVALTLTAEQGEVRIVAEPPDADVLVDGQPRGKAGQSMTLSAVPHEIEVRRAGFEPHKATLTPRPGFPQLVRARLQRQGEAAIPGKATAAAANVRAASGHDLKLIRGGRFQMGASRREPGRRANETLRDVELHRPFYVAAREVTNAQFRKFKSDHASGRFGAHDLSADANPVVNVTWEEAAEYCNWLSAQEGLPAAYATRDGKLAAVIPLNTGYRLPTEAEWSRAARYQGGEPLRFPWGSALPATPRSGNFADESARSLVAIVLQGYDDRFPATAPVGSFPPNALGLFDLGGNVAEWVNDVYAIPPPDAPVERDPTGPRDGPLHVILGSSFLQGTVSELRLSYRDYGTKARPDVGFRVARYAE
jgi:formylglycine-generating enzyme required for sulfatase activity